MAKQRTYILAPENLELAKKIAKKIYGDENYNLKAIVDYCLNHENEKLKRDEIDNNIE